jgi:hypothetical protein
MKAQEMNDILFKAKHMSTAQLQAEVDSLEAAKERPVRTTSLVASEDTEANPMGGVLENVPATIVAPVPGPPDFNGASAVVARLPNIGFAPSMLEEKGFESRGTFTVRQSRAGESFYLRIYGKLNHNIRCTIRGFVLVSISPSQAFCATEKCAWQVPQFDGRLHWQHHLHRFQAHLHRKVPGETVSPVTSS